MEKSDTSTEDKKSPKINAIQGLRGVAVLLVIFCHLELPFFKNGFIGVDIFFVISGFLITRIMAKEYISNRVASKRQGWISLLGFYSRRIRRIVPASFFVIALVVLVGTLIPKAVSLKSTLISDASWAAFFLSNLNYADQATQYFGEARQQSPLLHFWSLAVEEQFYLFWPVFFLTITSAKGFKIGRFVFNWRNRLRAAMFIVTLLSFFAYILLTSQDATSSYFSSIGRFWEFSIGAIFSLGIQLKSSQRLNSFAYFALFSLVGLFITFNTTQLRYSLILFVIFTGYMLHASVNNQLPRRFARFLENRILCFIGEISFSLYLIHWPLIVFLKNFGVELRGPQILLIFVGMVLLSYFLYKEVELRFMKITIPTVSKRSAARRTRYFPLNYDALKYSSVMIILFILFVNFQVGNSKPLVTQIFKAKVVEPWVSPKIQNDVESPKIEGESRPLESQQSDVSELWRGKVLTGLSLINLPDGIQPSLAQLDADRKSYWSACLSPEEESDACNSGQKNAKRKVYIIGDSYALSLSPMIQEAFSSEDYYVVSRIKGQCMVPDVRTLVNGIENFDCKEHRVRVNNEIAREKPDLVIATSWNADRVIGGDAGLLIGMERQFAFLMRHTKHLIVVGEMPALPDPRECFDSNKKIALCIGKEVESRKYRVITEKVAAKVGTPYLDISNWLCVLGSCPPVIDNNFVTWDGGHLTSGLSRKFAPLFSEYLASLGINN